MIPNNTILVSIITDDVRATGDPYESGVTQNTYYSIMTSIVSASEFEELHNMVDSSMFGRMGAVGLDGLFVPYTTDPNYTGVLPKMTIVTSGDINSSKLNTFNPDQIYDSGTFNADSWAKSGHNISMALTAHSGATESGIDAGLYPASPYFDADFYARGKTEANKVRSVALRNPLMIAGPGYDTAGNPIPSGTGTDFHPEAWWNTSIWPVGPLDIRYDRSKGMWVTGNATVEIMDFVIDSPTESIGASSAACNSVRVTVTDVGHTTTSVEIGDTGVIVFDEDLCFFNLPLSLLVGLKGKARAYKNIYADDVVDDCLTTGVVEASFRWKVTGLGCGEEIDG
jgi:hypothetical protein